MATRKKKKKGTSKRRGRRRVSGVHPMIADVGMLAAGAGLGALVASFGTQAIRSSFPTMPAYVGGATMAALGLATPMFVKPSPMVYGFAAGCAGMGLAFTVNETFLSLPGISGVPNGVPSARPGYLNQPSGVGAYGKRGIPGNRIGNLSGASAGVVGAIMSN